MVWNNRQLYHSNTYYHIAESSSKTIDVVDWLSDNQGDPAILDFNNKLKDHLLARLVDLAFDGEEYNQMYLHSFLRVNYTTYDLHHEQDSNSSQTHPDLMALSHEDSPDRIVPHPYWYGHVIHIFHIDVLHFKPSTELNLPDIQCINVLFVCWFRHETIVCGIQLIPAFTHGRTGELLPPSVAHSAGEIDNWKLYYVNM
ncbi:hypothetical protein PAXRUDRAFT_33363 [Paxillus rubicundulus Ve08.2h10]|uniref:Unplaced genomic scaffold scaffold_265, whole genome shotgun sequence n=1 Tax=Paxillus rubicundulus Ve08.2h10 TaxID=930991 RepID=A0A0D0E2E7_9AGAM|nr:hypothetical protein PAXRUDRAFT_33363 [Paxillus rubicundulus Ve08.2h10]